MTEHSPQRTLPFRSCYKSHLSTDQNFRLIRKGKADDDATSDEARLREGLAG